MNALGPELSLRVPASASRTALLWAGITLSAALQLQLACSQPINWDEFRFLSDLYAYRRGDLATPVQTLHVHLFGWLAGRFGSEIDQIIAGRLAMLALQLGSATLIYHISRAFTTHDPALLAVLAFLSFSFVLKHGASFRYDPIATFLLMGAAALLLTSRLRWSAALAAGAAIGVAGLITIKSVLFLPLLGLIAGWRLRKAEAWRETLAALVIAGTTSAAVFLLLYLAHKAALFSAADGQATVVASAQKTLGEGRVLPRSAELVRSLLENPIHWILLSLGVGAAIRKRLWIGFAFLLPLVTLLFYRNAFPYFFAFMLAPASPLFAIAATRADVRRFLPLLATCMIGAAVGQAYAVDRPVLDRQRATLEAARSIFPASTPYLDRCSMRASSPQAGFFMSSWGMEKYLSAARPVIRESVSLHGARYLIANHPQLELSLAGSNKSRLLPLDATVLHENFIPHWGAIWVLGKRLPSSPTPRSFELLASGPYTVESAAPVRIDGILRRPNDVITLAAGAHLWEAAASLTLRWGYRLHRPAAPEPRGALFANF